MPEMHLHDGHDSEVLTEAIVRLRGRARVSIDVPPLDGPRSPADAARARRRDHHARPASAASRRSACSTTVLAPACISVDHPRFLSFVPAAPTEAVDPVRSRRRGVQHLRRLVAGGRRRGVRRERGAALHRRPRRAARRGRRRVRQRWHCRQPQCADRGAVPVAGCELPVGSTAFAGADPGVEGRALVRSPQRRGRWTPTCSSWPPTRSVGLHGDGAPATPSPSIADDRPGARVRRSSRRAGTTNAGVDRRSGRRRRSSLRPNSAPGCTSMVPTAAPALAAPSVRSKVRRCRACGQLHRRPAQVAVRAVRLLRAALPPTRQLARAAHTQHAEYLDVLHGSEHDGPDAVWNAERLRPPPVPPRPRAAVLVQPRHLRHRRLPRCGGAPRSTSPVKPQRT